LGCGAPKTKRCAPPVKVRFEIVQHSRFVGVALRGTGLFSTSGVFKPSRSSVTAATGKPGGFRRDWRRRSRRWGRGCWNRRWAKAGSRCRRRTGGCYRSSARVPALRRSKVRIPSAPPRSPTMVGRVMPRMWTRWSPACDIAMPDTGLATPHFPCWPSVFSGTRSKRSMERAVTS
jgi:hypothetical protein